MKVTITCFAALTALAVAAPFQADTHSLAQPKRVMTLKRSELRDSGLFKRTEIDAIADPASVLGKRGDDVTDSVNYILVTLKEDDDRTDAYQDEIDAVADPASVLGKRGDDVTDSVNYILVTLKEDDGRTDAYQDEIDAVADPAKVLGEKKSSR